ncbi:hypothetical protein [Sphingobacterium siyangense]|jgi:hypothetical protein|uniref:hypothetical protein n=1 Tax=Sphingobacterium siyangense TaxID=459529 RepID=UPI0028A876F5|nr:hypothetical protein [Sphingobacterium siyangense]
MNHFKYSYYIGALILLSLQIACQEKSKPQEAHLAPAKTTERPVKDTVLKDTALPKHAKLDSIDHANAQSVLESDEVTKAYVKLTAKDSIIRLHSNIRIDHRFFGYEQADTQAKKLLLFSIFTNDVEHNPFQLKLGAYYDTSGLDSKGSKLKYVDTKGDFVQAKFIDSTDIPVCTIYFEKKWVEIE